MLMLFLQKLSALSASLARMVPVMEEEETQLDHFPADGVRNMYLMANVREICVKLT